MTRGIELTRQLYANTVEGRTLAYRMTVRVSRANGVDPNIFLYQRQQVAEGAADPVDVFIAVCTPVDLEEYPVAAPASSTGFFRVADIDLIARSASQLEDAWRVMQLDRDELIRTLEALDAATGEQTSSYGDLGDESSSSSSEPSSSSSASEPPAPATCSPVAYSALRVVYSTDPAFPVDTVLDLALNEPEAPTCVQVFSGEGVGCALDVGVYSPTGVPRTFIANKTVGTETTVYSEGVAGDASIVLLTEVYSVELRGE